VDEAVAVGVAVVVGVAVGLAVGVAVAAAPQFAAVATMETVFVFGLAPYLPV
jgi:hypothetical protein